MKGGIATPKTCFRPCTYMITLAPHVIQVGENERFVGVEPAGNDVLGVLVGQSVCLLYSQVLPQKLLVIGHLNYERNVENILQVPVRWRST